MPARSLDRHPDLVVAATYERTVEAPIEPVWENVYDWEHLPWLHAQAFSSIDLRESGDWGWHVDVGFANADGAEIELVVDAAHSRYVARTRSGSGAGGETWTTLTARIDDRTDVLVEFCVPPLGDDAVRAIGAGMVSLYEGLWDQDESMILERRSAMAARDERAAARGGKPGPVDLGPVEVLRSSLPRLVDFGGSRFRVIERGGAFLVHAVECPHWLGPLDGCDPEAAELVCPWHGYRFDPATGESVDGRGLRHRPAPRVEVEGGRALLVGP